VHLLTLLCIFVERPQWLMSTKKETEIQRLQIYSTEKNCKCVFGITSCQHCHPCSVTCLTFFLFSVHLSCLFKNSWMISRIKLYVYMHAHKWATQCLSHSTCSIIKHDALKFFFPFFVVLGIHCGIYYLFRVEQRNLLQ
jgi:hypothetical protein